MFGENGEPCVLDDGVPDRAEFEMMSPLGEDSISVDPGQEAGDVVQLGKVDNRFVDLYLKAPHELALEDAVVDLSGGLLLGSEGLGGVLLPQD